ncbi:Qat anti-phage system associated protein QatB [Hydrogenophaga sp.]|nr:Qat anti-phage system associated protein QatB [Hydrogenophaga sp.]
MSTFLGGGGSESLRSAAKSMVTKGMGGSRRAASTMRGTAQGAGALGQFLASARDRSDPRVANWVDRTRQANLAADDLILELVKEVMPDTGSVDDESLRNAAAEALGLLYELNPDIDIFNLSDAQIHDVMAITIANDVCNRMDLQLGQAYEKLKYDAQQIQVYRKDVKEYVQSEVRVVMERLGTTGLDPKRLARDVLQSAMEVFAS